MPLSMRADSTEFLTASITADHDLTNATIEVALPQTNVAPTVWYSAQKVSTTQVGQRWQLTYRLLLGPAGGATQLTPGNYDWTPRLTDSPGPEVVVRKASVLTITST